MRLRLKTRIGAGFIVAIASLLVTLAVTGFYLGGVMREARDVRDRLGPAVEITSDLLLALEQMENAEFLYFLGGEGLAKWAPVFDTHAGKFEDALARVETIVQSPSRQGAVAEISHHYRALAVLDGHIREMLATGRSAEAEHLNLTASLAEAAGARAAIRSLRSSSLATILKAQEHVETALLDVGLTIMAISLLGIAVGGFWWWRSAWIIAAPIEAVQHAATALALREFQQVDHPAARRTTEIEALQTEFNRMVRDLAAATGEIESAQATLEQEVARRTRDLESARSTLEGALENLKTLDTMKSDLLSVVSHELLTPINFVMAYASTLQDGVLGELSPPQSHAVAEILAGAGRLARMVRNVLDYTRLEGGRVALFPESVDYPAMLIDVVAAATRAAEEKNVVIDTSISPSLPQVWADPGRLWQVLGELLDNAVKFSPAGGRVSVTVREEDRSLVTEVENERAGAAVDGPAAVPSAISPFSQGDFSSTREHGGLGLGLAIVHSLVTAMKGSIRVGKAPGGTISVRVALPVAGSAGEAGGAHPGTGGEAAVSPEA